jgi:hypothetical protein
MTYIVGWCHDNQCNNTLQNAILHIEANHKGLIRSQGFSRSKHSSLLVPFASYEENKVLWMRSLLNFIAMKNANVNLAHRRNIRLSVVMRFAQKFCGIFCSKVFSLTTIILKKLIRIYLNFCFLEYLK